MPAEQDRLHDGTWKQWGPYLAERAWGTVREDYSEHGEAWDSFPHDHARSRAYRWSEDGLGAICDDGQRLCFGFAFWNGRDPILKERIFGLNGSEGNHGEDAKEYWWYLDATPTHSWMRWAYVYPQNEFPYAALIHHRRSRSDPELELLDTGVFDDDRYWDITVDYAKSAPADIVMRMTVRNAGPDRASLHVLPTLWFRNTWSWEVGSNRPIIRTQSNTLIAEHSELGTMVLSSSSSAPTPGALFCDNDSNASRLWGVDGPAFPKDGINDHVVHGSATVNPEAFGTKASLWYQLDVDAGESVEVLLRLSPHGSEPDVDVLARRSDEADEFYAALLGSSDPEGAAIARQAFAGMLWSKQFFHYDVEKWLDGDALQPPPPAARLRGRNREWRHLNNADVISMPDTWEYPWYAAWDLAFHTVALAHVDPQFAKDQLLLVLREWYQHPNGQIPAYEWAFGDVNPPVHAWAAMRVFEIDGGKDYDFLERIIHKLLLNFTWWVNRKDALGDNVFEGGFLGLDNIGPIDRSAALPDGGQLEQSDGTAWMAMFCLDLLDMCLRLAEHDPTYEDLATKFLEHFANIATAIEGLWNEEDGFYQDMIVLGGGRLPLRVFSMVGLLPLVATTTLGPDTLARLPRFAGQFRWFLRNKPKLAESLSSTHILHGVEGRLLSMVRPDRLERILSVLLDEDEFLSPHGIRALSARHRDHPFAIDLDGATFSVGYEPAESRSGLFGGNSNWRGPVWFPVNHLVAEALRRFARFYGEDLQVECPTGSGQRMGLAAVADEVERRLVALFRRDSAGRRPVFGTYEKFQTDPRWAERLLFHEYFHGDTGAGLGASHQTGWTGLVGDIIVRAQST